MTIDMDEAMDYDEFKEKDCKAFTPWSEDQLSYLEDRLTSFMTRLHRYIRESEKLRDEMKEALDEIKKNRKEHEEQNDLNNSGKGDSTDKQ